MARSDSFFIRADLNCGGSTGTGFNTYFQTAVDLGAYVDALGKSVLRIHNIAVSFTNSGNGIAARCYDQFDNLPQLWTNGYLIAVDQMYLGGQASEYWEGDVVVSVTMECTVETMTQAAAMALALSQQ